MGAPSNTEKKNALSAFTQKALQRIQDKKVVKHRKLYIPSLEEEITIRNLTYKEIVEITEMDNRPDDPNYADKFTIYQAVTSPNLKDVATELKNAGQIIEYIEVIDMFDFSEIQDIATQIMNLSGFLGNENVKIIDELKN